MWELLIGLIPIGAILLITLIICLICAIFEIKRNTAETVERLTEIADTLNNLKESNDKERILKNIDQMTKSDTKITDFYDQLS